MVSVAPKLHVNPLSVMPKQTRDLTKLSSRGPTSNLSVAQRNDTARAAAAALVASFKRR